MRENGTVFAWGANTYGQLTNHPSATNAIAIAAGAGHNLALKADAIVIGWGRNDYNQTAIPGDVGTVAAISAGGNQSLALRQNGTVKQWGQAFANPPTGLTNVTAIASGTNFHLALSNKTVVAWGNNGAGQLNVPGPLSNVVAIAAGEQHALALQGNGIVIAWGSNGSGQTNVPTGLSNVMAITAGRAHSLALKNDGTVVGWSDNTYGQAAAQTGLNGIKMIAAGSDFNLASAFSPVLQYPIDVSKDLLLVYNTNSLDSSNVCSYYLNHRPMVANANVLGIGCVRQETIARVDFTNTIRQPILNWLSTNQTKRPEYWILFLDVPSRINLVTNAGSYNAPYDNSVSYELYATMQNSPLVTHINMGGTNDCIAYIDKLATNSLPASVLLSVSASGYGNTNFLMDNVRHGPGWPLPENDYSGSGATVSNAITGVSGSGTPGLGIIYVDGIETNGLPPLPHITSATNIAGYISWGFHSSLGNTYALNGTLSWGAKSSWYLVETIESYNGQRVVSSGNFIQWFSPTAFGGTSYAKTPVGAVTHTDEPGLPFVSNSQTYFGLWASGKNFAISAWSSRRTARFQAVGDPLVRR